MSTEEVAKEIAAEEQQQILETVAANDSGMGGYAICPRCQWDTRHETIPVGEDDKKEFLRCVLGGQQFTKEYELFNGGLVVKFTDLTSEQADIMVNAMQDMTEDPMFLPKAIKIKILFALVSIKSGDNEQELDRNLFTVPMTSEEALQHYSSVFGGTSDTICGAVSKLYNEFTALLMALTEAGFDSDFWKGVGRD